MLLLSIDALEGICNEVITNFNASTSVFLRRPVWKDNVKPTLADLGIATELLDEGRVFLGRVVDYLDQFG